MNPGYFGILLAVLGIVTSLIGMSSFKGNEKLGWFMSLCYPISWLVCQISFLPYRV